MYFHPRKCIWKCHPRNGGNFVSTSICQWFNSKCFMRINIYCRRFLNRALWSRPITKYVPNLYDMSFGALICALTYTQNTYISRSPVHYLIISGHCSRHYGCDRIIKGDLGVRHHKSNVMSLNNMANAWLTTVSIQRYFYQEKMLDFSSILLGICCCDWEMVSNSPLTHCRFQPFTISNMLTNDYIIYFCTFVMDSRQLYILLFCVTWVI